MALYNTTKKIFTQMRITDSITLHSFVNGFIISV